jgi:hypothetical protein
VSGVVERAKNALHDVSVVLETRASNHGDARDGLEAVSSMWSGLFGVGIGARDVAVAMAMLKLVRYSAGDRSERDHLVDSVGYLALALGLVEGDDESA